MAALTSTTNLSSHQFVLCAGSVLFRKSDSKVCLIGWKSDTKLEWFFPKGRKNIGESLPDCAVRETYEETGFQCSLLPVSLSTRATSPGGIDYPDTPRILSTTLEPFMVSLRQIGGSSVNQKLIFWYVTQINENIPREPSTQMPNESFAPKLVSMDEAMSMLTFENDKSILQEAYKLFQDSLETL